MLPSLRQESAGLQPQQRFKDLARNALAYCGYACGKPQLVGVTPTGVGMNRNGVLVVAVRLCYSHERREKPWSYWGAVMS